MRPISDHLLAPPAATGFPGRRDLTTASPPSAEKRSTVAFGNTPPLLNAFDRLGNSVPKFAPVRGRGRLALANHEAKVPRSIGKPSQLESGPLAL